MADLVGQRFGNYRLLRHLGTGSFADVYLGRHLYLKDEVAIKVLSGNLDEETTQHFLKEAHHLRELHHSHVIGIHDAGIEGSVPFLVMEYAPGGTMRERYPKGCLMPLSTVVASLYQIASALDYAHENRLIHRDLKPENLLLNQAGSILLSDFGVALPMRHTESMSVPTIGGTLAYMAPEQIRGKPRAASDQYALGILAYEWLTGHRPFSGGVAELCGQHLFVPPPTLRDQLPDLPPSVEVVVCKALAKEPQARFESCLDFAVMFERASRGELLRTLQDEHLSQLHRLPQPPHQPETVRLPRFNTLPAQVSSLIGREREREAACVLLVRPEVRLLTMTGPGGIGKTRLALSVASDALSTFADGACFVPLAHISNPDQVVPALLQTLGIKEQSDLSPIASLIHVLHDQHLLLVLDNFEQVSDAAPLLLELLVACPDLSLLVTSRALLHIPGEHTFPVPPLALPDLLGCSSREIASCPSVALFVERARALKPDFEVTTSNADTLGKLSQQLEGIPLALELAAARITMLTPAQLLTRISRRLDLLAGPGGARPARQQTIRQTIRWSYELLSPSEQFLFCCFSVFVGGCRLSDLEALYERLDADPFSVMDGVGSLVDKSLLILRVNGKADSRLDQLETIREFGHEMLRESGQQIRVSVSHAQYYASLVEAPQPAQLGLAQGSGLELLKREYKNLLAALHCFQREQEMGQALRLAVGMGGIWFVNGYGSEGQEELTSLLTLCEHSSDQIPLRLLVMALTLCGRICGYTADLDQSVKWYRKSLRLARTLGDIQLLALTIGGLAFVEGELGNYSEADALSEEGITTMQEIGAQAVLARVAVARCHLWLRRGMLDRARDDAERAIEAARASPGQQVTLATALHLLGWRDSLAGDLKSAFARGKESVTLFRALGFAGFGLEALSTLASQTAALGDLVTARSLFQDALSRAEAAGERSEIGRVLCGLGYVALRQKHFSEASRLFLESVRTVQQVKHISTRFLHIVASSLEGLAALAIQDGEARRAARLLGTAQALRNRWGSFDPLGREAAILDQSREAIEKALGRADFAQAFHEGKGVTPLQVLSREEKIASEQRSNEPSLHPIPLEGHLPSGDHLTRREMDVLRELSQGKTNAQIAEDLVLSVVTVNSYLRAMYSKMGVSSRTAALRCALDHHLL